MRRFALSSWTAIALVAVGVGSCASSGRGGPDREEVFLNAPACAELVDRHRADPSLPVHAPATPLSIVLPGRRERGAEATIRFTVTEAGDVDRESIEVEGDVSPELRGHLVEVTAPMRFQPARVGDCWVASTYSWQYTG